MRLFWKVNLYVTIIVFILFLLYFIAARFSFLNPSISNLFMSLTFLFFYYGAFLEIFQIPLCTIAFFFNYKPKRAILIFFMMFVSFILKICLFVYLLGFGL